VAAEPKTERRVDLMLAFSSLLVLIILALRDLPNKVE
jgi:hypothetical protein